MNFIENCFDILSDQGYFDASLYLFFDGIDKKIRNDIETLLVYNIHKQNFITSYNLLKEKVHNNFRYNCAILKVLYQLVPTSQNSRMLEEKTDSRTSVDVLVTILLSLFIEDKRNSDSSSITMNVASVIIQDSLHANILDILFNNDFNIKEKVRKCNKVLNLTILQKLRNSQTNDLHIRILSYAYAENALYYFNMYIFSIFRDFHHIILEPRILLNKNALDFMNNSLRNTGKVINRSLDSSIREVKDIVNSTPINPFTNNIGLALELSESFGLLYIFLYRENNISKVINIENEKINMNRIKYLKDANIINETYEINSICRTLPYSTIKRKSYLKEEYQIGTIDISRLTTRSVFQLYPKTLNYMIKEIIDKNGIKIFYSLFDEVYNISIEENYVTNKLTIFVSICDKIRKYRDSMFDRIQDRVQIYFELVRSKYIQMLESFECLSDKPSVLGIYNNLTKSNANPEKEETHFHKDIYIAPYKRKLQKNVHASSEKMKEASAYNFVLEKGETFVNGHIRNQIYKRYDSVTRTLDIVEGINL